MRILVLFLLTFHCGLLIQGQQESNSSPKPGHYFDVRNNVGKILQTNVFVKGENTKNKPINYYQAFNVAYGVQTDGSKPWHHVLNFPFYGAALHHAVFFETDEMGPATAFYGFLGFPIKRSQRVSCGYGLGLGLTYNWKPYDKMNNAFNVAIGSYLTSYIEANLFCRYDLNSRWGLYGTLGFTHFSNGGIRKPNKGLNMLSPSLGMNYYFDDRPLLIRKTQAHYAGHYELALHLGLGIRSLLYKNHKPLQEVNKPHGATHTSYAYGNWSCSLLKQSTWKHKFGAGFDLTYDEGLNVVIKQPENGNEPPEVRPSSHLADKVLLGLHGTYEFTIDRLSIASYFGVLTLRKKSEDANPFLYQKIGFKYHFKNDMYCGLLVRAHHFSVAEVMEWNIGYRIKWGTHHD